VVAKLKVKNLQFINNSTPKHVNSIVQLLVLNFFLKSKPEISESTQFYIEPPKL